MTREQQLIGRIKTERMSQAEFEQYAKEHGYIISTTNIIEQIRAEIEETIESYVCDKEENTMKAQGMLNAMQMTFEIIDKYTK